MVHWTLTKGRHLPTLRFGAYDLEMDFEHLALLAENLRPWAVPLATLMGALAAARITWHFGSVQAGIARQQAETASLAAATARNKLKLELFDRRFELYKVVRDYAHESGYKGPEGILGSETSELLFHVMEIRWLFGQDLHEWVHEEFLPMLAAVREANRAMAKDQDLSEGQLEARDRYMEMRREFHWRFEPFLLLSH